MLRSLLVERQLSNFEMGAVANLCPEKADEVRSLIPSIFSAVSVLLSLCPALLCPEARCRRTDDKWALHSGLGKC